MNRRTNLSPNHAPELLQALPAATVAGVLAVGEDEAARMLGISTRTLQRMRNDGSAPPSALMGARRRLYPVAELQAWVARSTQGAGA